MKSFNIIDLKNINTPKILFAIFVILWVFLAIDPVYRPDWFLENIVIFVALPFLLWSYFRFRLSNTSYILIFIFAVLHIAAAHYTYSFTPWGDKPDLWQEKPTKSQI